MRNLISGSLLVQQGYTLVFESSKVVITKALNFIRKGFLSDDLFKLNVKNFTLVPPIALNIEPSVTLQQRLGYVNYNSIKKLTHLNLIPTLNINDHNKCEICVVAKLPKKSFKFKDRDSEILKLIHGDVSDPRRTSRGGNKYFVTFINDCSKFYH